MIAKDLIRKIRKIEIMTNRLVNDQLAGQYHSVFKGRGMAFSEVRQYQPGDDIRFIDWNVTARMNDVFVKLFTEEREMTVMLLVDMSASTLFGTYEQSKRELAAEIAAMMAFSAIKNNDRVGLIIFTDQVERFVPPKKGKKHVLRVISEILSYQPQSTKTNIHNALRFFGHVTKRRCVAFLMSDFVPTVSAEPTAGHAKTNGGLTGMERGLEHALKVMARKHDLIPVTITDPFEQEIPRASLINFVDLESGELVTIDSHGPEARAYATYMQRSREAREALFRRLKIEFLHLSTHEPYVGRLVDFFRARQRRLRH